VPSRELSRSPKGKKTQNSGYQFEINMFYDRKEAGRALAQSLLKYKENPQTIVLGLARGGVVVAFEVAQTISLPLNVVVPRKIGAPDNPELALGAIMEDGQGVFNNAIIHLLGVPPFLYPTGN
jgi:putative phosphoribosyl transferase